MSLKIFVASHGLEPCQTEPKSVVLPLHHEAENKVHQYLAPFNDTSRWYLRLNWVIKGEPYISL